MELLGRHYNALADGLSTGRANVTDAGQVSVLVVSGGANQITVNQHDAAAAGNTEALNFDHVYTQTDGVWTRVAVEPAANTFTPGAAVDVVVIEIPVTALDDGFSYVAASQATAGTPVILLGDLSIQRTPANLRDVTA